VLGNGLRPEGMRSRALAGMIRAAGATAMAVALAVFSAAGQAVVVDTSVKKVGIDTLTKAAVVDTSVKKAGVDTSLKKVSIDTSAKAVIADTSVKKSSIDTLTKTAAVDTSVKKVIADTLTKTAVADTSIKKSGIDSLTKTAAVDTSVKKSGADTLASAAAVSEQAIAAVLDSLMSAFDEFEDPPRAGFWASVAANAFYVLFFAASLAVIAATLYFYLTRRDTRRFLTTTRLSVLNRMVQKGCRYIESNYSDPTLSVTDVCEELVTGEAYLDAIFEKELGITVKDFITQVRVNNIKNMLANTASPDLEKICVQCGFPDRAFAERQFAGLNGGAGIAEYARALYAGKK